MRKGYEPCLAFDHNDRLVAIATGSDACAEHECGSKPLREALCGPRASGTKNFYRWKANEKEAHHVRVLRDPRRRAAVLQSIRGE